MKLRPHHLLCIQLFAGHGYDAAFTSHMTKVVSLLHLHPQTEIQLHCGCDDLCAVCPHNRNGVCSSPEKTRQLDDAVLRECGLQDGQCAEWQTLAESASGRILQTDRFAAVCGNCQWYMLCCETAGKEDAHATESDCKTENPDG